MKFLVLLSVITLLLTGCYISKPVTTPCSLYINPTFQIDYSKPIDHKYLNETLTQTYHNAFLKGLKNELSLYGVTVTESEHDKTDFYVSIQKLSLRESANTETVNDEKSEFNGQKYTLHACDAGADFSLFKNGKKSGSWWASVDKAEKLTNNRNVGDYVFGTNKDNSQYRHKGIAEDIFIDLCERCGRRTAAVLTKKISKQLKK